MLYQIFSALQSKDRFYRFNKRLTTQWWEVKFAGEGIIDQGGGFRDSLSEVGEELSPSDPEVLPRVPIFIKYVGDYGYQIWRTFFSLCIFVTLRLISSLALPPSQISEQQRQDWRVSGRICVQPTL